MHDGHTHGGGHTHSFARGVSPEKTLALLSYMLQHNREHTQELADLGIRLEQSGKAKAARQLKAATEEYERGNKNLEAAIASAK